jgi:hypothetical protein
MPFSPTYTKEFDRFGNFHVPDDFGVVWIYVPSFLLACLVHPSLNNNLISDVSWTFSSYLEAVAILPQLIMFQKRETVVEALNAHFVFALGFSRLLQLVFWMESYHELKDNSGLSPSLPTPPLRSPVLPFSCRVCAGACLFFAERKEGRKE